MRLRTILFVLAILSLVTAGAGGYFLNSHLTNTAWGLARDHTEKTAEMVRKQVASSLEHHGKFSATLSRMPQFASVLRNTNKATLASANAVLDRECASLEASVCYLMDATGETIASSNRRTPVSFVGKNYGFRPYFKEAIEGKPSVYLALGVTSKKRGFYMSAPVIGGPQRVTGVVVMKFSVENLEREFSTLSGIFALTNSKGMVFASNQKQWLFRSLSKLTDKDAEEIRKSRQFGEEEPSSVGLIEARDRRIIAPDGTNYLLSKKLLSIPAGWHITYLFDTAGIATQLKSGLGRVPVGTVLVVLFAVIAIIVIFLYRKAASEIAKRNQAERALRESEERFRAIFDSSPYAIVLKDFDSRYLMVNDTFASWMKTDISQIVGKSVYDFYLKEHADIGVENDRMVFDSGETHTSEGERMFGDGILRTVITHKSPICSSTGDVVATSTIISDISERKGAEKAREIALVEAEQANQAKSEFLATMSHEFRTPLNAILGFSEMLRAQYFGPLGANNYREYANDIHESGEHMLALVNDVLDISAIEAGKRPVIKEAIAVDELMKDCLKNVEHAADDQGILLSLEIPEAFPTLYADRRSIMQIILNLLSNAIKFTNPKGAISLSAEMINGEMVISVKDSGIGIPTDKLAAVTEPFSQVESNPYRSQQGTGLGLAIVKSLVEANNGYLNIESEVAAGTHVSVSFPRHDV